MLSAKVPSQTEGVCDLTGPKFRGGFFIRAYRGHEPRPGGAVTTLTTTRGLITFQVKTKREDDDARYDRRLHSDVWTNDYCSLGITLLHRPRRVAPERGAADAAPSRDARHWQQSDWLVARWCGRQMAMWVGEGPNLARDWAHYGKAMAPKPGPIGVMNGHVGVVKEIQGHLVILVSGNHTGKSGNRKVGIGSYSINQFIAFREP